VADESEHAVHVGNTGGMGGSEDEGARDPEKARAFIERSAEDAARTPGEIDVHEAEVGADLGADDAGSDAPERA
jgi:hypothetical protein